MVNAKLDLQAFEQEEFRARQLRAVVTKSASGSTDIGHTFWLDNKFRLVFVRCHFVGTSGAAALAISLDSVTGSAFDAKLFTVSQAGIGADVFLRIGADDTREPSAWTFQSGDRIRIDWTSPDLGNINWGLEVGLVLAS